MDIAIEIFDIKDLAVDAKVDAVNGDEDSPQ